MDGGTHAATEGEYVQLFTVCIAGCGLPFCAVAVVMAPEIARGEPFTQRLRALGASIPRWVTRANTSAIRLGFAGLGLMLAVMLATSVGQPSLLTLWSPVGLWLMAIGLALSVGYVCILWVIAGFYVITRRKLSVRG
jgi:hypothetical protein